MSGTDSEIDTPVARGSSRPVRYELIDKDGRVAGRYATILKLHQDVADMWPDQEQDPDRTGKGWDIQVVR